MNIRQQRALGALARGLTLKQAASISGYKNPETVWKLKQSKIGKTYLEQVRSDVHAETIFAIKDRLGALATITKMNLYSQPYIALSAVKEANRLAQ